MKYRVEKKGYGGEQRNVRNSGRGVERREKKRVRDEKEEGGGERRRGKRV